MIRPMDEGYIKFKIEWNRMSFDFPDTLYNQMSAWRAKFYILGLIGQTSEGIGFGNISMRMQKGFVITGSATGGIIDLPKDGYSWVQKYDIEKNTVICQGLSKASSESLSHAALYESSNDIGAVVHLHSAYLWENYYNTWPKTETNALYGTPQMAVSLNKLAGSLGNNYDRTIIMSGHKDGILAYGKNIDEAGNLLLTCLKT